MLISVQMLSELGTIIVAMIFVGQLPDSALYLSGVGFARTFVNVTGTAMAWFVYTYTYLSTFTLQTKHSLNITGDLQPHSLPSYPKPSVLDIPNTLQYTFKDHSIL